MIKKYDTFRDRDYKYHVVTILDEEPETQVVIKYYGKRKQWWHYEIKALWVIERSLKDGLYTNHKKAGISPDQNPRRRKGLFKMII